MWWRPLISAWGSKLATMSWAPGTGVVVLLPAMLAARLPSSCLMVVESLNISVSRSSSRRMFSRVTSSHLNTSRGESDQDYNTTINYSITHL